MKVIFKLPFGILLVLAILFGCKNEKTTSGEEEIAEKTESQVIPEKPDDQFADLDPNLDPILVGKEFSKVFADTLNIEMYATTLKPGDSVGLHEHLDHSVYVLEGGKLLVYMNGTDPVEMELTKGTGFFSGPLKDAAVNTGNTDVTLLIHEFHRPRK